MLITDFTGSVFSRKKAPTAKLCIASASVKAFVRSCIATISGCLFSHCIPITIRPINKAGSYPICRMIIPVWQPPKEIGRDPQGRCNGRPLTFAVAMAIKCTILRSLREDAKSIHGNGFETSCAKYAECARSGIARSGIVLFRLRRGRPQDDAQRIVAILTSRDDWSGHFSVVDDDKIRMRVLPPPSTW